MYVCVYIYALGNLCSFNAPNSPQSTLLCNSPSALPLASILQCQQLNPTQLISQISFLLQQNDLQRNLLIEMMGLHGNDLEPPSIKPLKTKANQVNNINKSEQLPHITGNIKPREMSTYLVF